MNVPQDTQGGKLEVQIAETKSGTALAVSLTSVAVAPAVSAAPTNVVTQFEILGVDNPELSDEDLAQLEKDLEMLFAECMSWTDDDTFVANKKKHLNLAGKRICLTSKNRRMC